MLKTAALVAALVLLLGCNGGKSLTPPLRVKTPNPGQVEQDVRARLNMTVRGDETLDLDVETTLHIVEILGGRTPVVTWFLSVSAGEQVKLKDGRTMLFTADLSPGLYRGKGSYTMNEKGAVDVGGQSSPLGSAAYVQFLDVGPPPKVARFDKLAEACKLTVTEDAISGTVDCPKLASEEGGSVSLTWAWERI